MAGPRETICPNCRADIAATSAFCSRCGQVMHATSSPLTPNEQQRIYKEEKVRVEAQEHAKNEIAYARPFSWGKFLFLAIILGGAAFFPLMLLYLFFIAPMLGIKDPSPGGAMVFAFIVGCLAARLFYRPVQRPL